MSCRIVVLLSGSGSNLQALIDDRQSATDDGKIVAVISNRPKAFGLERAKKAGIDTAIINHRDFSSRETFDQTLAQTIESYKPDLVVLAGFMRILTPDFVSQFEGRMLNIHPSLLPKYRGLHTHQRVLEDQGKEHGASIHFVTAELDGGPVVLQAKVPVYAEDTEQELAQRVLVQEHHIYPLAVHWFCARKLYYQQGHVYLDQQPLNQPRQFCS